MTNYRFTELWNQLVRGPHEDEDFFRVQVQGNGQTRWLNITGVELAKIAIMVGEHDDA